MNRKSSPPVSRKAWSCESNRFPGKRVLFWNMWNTKWSVRYCLQPPCVTAITRTECFMHGVELSAEVSFFFFVFVLSRKRGWIEGTMISMLYTILYCSCSPLAWFRGCRRKRLSGRIMTFWLNGRKVWNGMRSYFAGILSSEKAHCSSISWHFPER